MLRNCCRRENCAPMKFVTGYDFSLLLTSPKYFRNSLKLLLWSLPSRISREWHIVSCYWLLFVISLFEFELKLVHFYTEIPQDTIAGNNSSVCSFYFFLLLILFFQLPKEFSFDYSWTNAWHMLNYRLTIVKRKFVRQWNNY